METKNDNSEGERVCKYCYLPLADNEHGNRKAHRECAKNYKKQHQREKYKIGNSAKLMIQRNEVIAANLHKMDPQKQGIQYLIALELGLKLNCPVVIREYRNKKFYFFDQYGYTIEKVNGKDLIYIYHESELK